MVSSDMIKASVASYWRYVRQCPLVALEATWGGQFSDVLAVTKNRFLIEVEVKVSTSDLRRDRQKPKHRLFVRGTWMSLPVHYFYFAVPKELGVTVALLCDHLYPYAGVMGTNGEIGFNGENGLDIEIYRKPQVLADRKLTFPELIRLARDQSATLCRLATKVAELKSNKGK